MHEILYQLRYSLPVWFLTLITSWLPDNRVTIKIRGRLLSFLLNGCGANFQVGRDVTLLGVDRLQVGRDVYLAKGTWINAIGRVTIEDEVIFGPYVVISSTNHGFLEGSVRFGGTHPAPVTIGRGSWLAAHVSVAAGVRVGRGNVVAANAVVTESTPDDVIVGGVPGKVICPRADNPSPVSARADVRA